MNCSKCNAPIENGAAFCHECGASVEPVQKDNREAALKSREKLLWIFTAISVIVIAAAAAIALIIIRKQPLQEAEPVNNQEEAADKTANYNEAERFAVEYVSNNSEKLHDINAVFSRKLNQSELQRMLLEMCQTPGSMSYAEALEKYQDADGAWEVCVSYLWPSNRVEGEDHVDFLIFKYIYFVKQHGRWEYLKGW